MFGEERLYEIIRQSRNLSAPEISSRILEEVRKFCGDHPQSDDITLMVIKALVIP